MFHHRVYWCVLTDLLRDYMITNYQPPPNA
jgi:hypothetical protein